MKTLGLALLVLLAGYVVGALLGVLLVQMLSTNQFDRGSEAVVTGALIVGPAIALLSVVGFFIVRLARRNRTSD